MLTISPIVPSYQHDGGNRFFYASGMYGQGLMSYAVLQDRALPVGLAGGTAILIHFRNGRVEVCDPIDPTSPVASFDSEGRDDIDGPWDEIIARGVRAYVDAYNRFARFSVTDDRERAFWDLKAR